MAVTSTVLIQSQSAPVVDTALYTSTNLSTIVDKFTAVNTSTTTAYTISVYLTASDITGADANVTVKTKTLQPLETYTFPEVVGHVLTSGGTLRVLASNAAITVRSSGRTVS